MEDIDPSLRALLVRATSQKKQIKKLFSKLKTVKPGSLDKLFHEHHERCFESIDCTKCARCCSSLGPRLTDRDIGQLSKYLSISPKAFISNYLTIDEDNDFVFTGMPCPFLGKDKLCTVYEVRPLACSGYPHTNEKHMHKRLQTTYLNAQICPAVASIVEQLRNAV